MNESIWYDYTNQAWVVNGVYKNCGHPESMQCRCFGRKHEGEKPTPQIIASHTEQIEGIIASE